MKLSFISITNYRSITDAYKINLESLTVLLGKNNEGKTNILKALTFGMNVIERIGGGAIGRTVLRREYDWGEDFPIKLQRYGKLKDKSTKIRFDFCMTDQECKDLFDVIGSNINGEISIYIQINQKNEFSITIPKRGKNASALSNKIKDICSFTAARFRVQYVPAIRAEDDAYRIISELIDTELSNIEDEDYYKSLNYVKNKQKEKLDSLANKIKKPLNTFLPKINSIELNLDTQHDTRRSLYSYRRNLDIRINDGVLTDLMNKGDGVKSLFTIAMLSQISIQNSSLIVIDEPENHLHPDGIRFISQVLNRLAEKCQVLISSHSPIFVNRRKIKSNIIVDEGMAKKAELLDDIRKNLGVSCSDNLLYADYIIIVEGPTDKKLLESYFYRDDELKSYLHSNRLMVRNIGGTNNLNGELQGLERFCCSYLILLDNDEAGRKAKQLAIDNIKINEDSFRFFSISGLKQSELEDLYNNEYCKNFLLQKGYDITRGPFRNKTKKWSDRISDIAIENGCDFSKAQKNKIKEELVEIIVADLDNGLSESGKYLLLKISEKIKEDIKYKYK